MVYPEKVATFVSQFITDMNYEKERDSYIAPDGLSG